MQHPAFQSMPKTILFAATCLLTGVALHVAESGLIQVPSDILLWDSLIHALVFGLLAYLLWFVVQFADLTNIIPIQVILNHFALIFALVFAWIGIPFLIGNFIWEENMVELNKALTLKIVFGIQLMLLLLLWLRHHKTSSLSESEDDAEQESIETIPQQQSIAVSEKKTERDSEITVHQKECLSTISVKTGQKIQMIQVADVLYLQAEGDYVLIQTIDGRHLKEQTMKYFEENLPSDSFVRVHRSCIVHVTFISRIELYEKQNYRITLKTGHQLKASQTGYKLLKQTLSL
jgi:DNA-binding LytR/AlgR family response regulator